ncbi:hypothetical protein [Neorhizobium tomejilense]|uniref:hypothetical protein n=1 Tax=Neorhizobium tomejilense TaxID=2093828 RepID=UPI003ECCB39A
MGKIDLWALVKKISVGVVGVLVLLTALHYLLGFSMIKLAPEPNQQRKVVGFFLYDYQFNDDVKNICERRSIDSKYAKLVGEACWQEATKDLEGLFGTWITKSKVENNPTF